MIKWKIIPNVPQNALQCSLLSASVSTSQAAYACKLLTLGTIVYLPQTARGKPSNALLLTNLLHTWWKTWPKKWKGLDKQTLPSSRLGDCLTGPCVTGDISSHGLLLEEMGRERERSKRGVKRQSESVYRPCGVWVCCPSVWIWMCLCRQPASLCTQINIWHSLHGFCGSASHRFSEQ